MQPKFLLLFVVVIAAVGGCGSSSSEPAPLSKAAFLKKADGICERAGNEQTLKAAAYLEKHRNANEAALVMPAGIPPLEKEIKELRELGLPEGREEKAEAFLDEVEKGLQALKEKPSLALSQENNPYKKANELGEKLGLVDCARNP